MCVHVRTACRSWISPFTMWILDTEFRSPYEVAKHLSNLADHYFYFDGVELCIICLIMTEAYFLALVKSITTILVLMILPAVPTYHCDSHLTDKKTEIDL